jgi:hypothetical protein
MRRTLWMDDRMPTVRAAGATVACQLALAVLGACGGTSGDARAESSPSPLRGGGRGEGSAEPAPRAARLTKRFALELDGQVVGLLDGVSGGGVKAEVIDQRTGPDGLLRKRLGRPHPQEISLQVGLAMAPAFYRWIAQTWEAGSARCQVPGARPDESVGQPSDEAAGVRLDLAPGAWHLALRRSGALLELDESGMVRTRREFVDARITEVSIPALDVGEKKPGALTVKILPESVRFVKGDAARRGGEAIRLETRTWLPCHFRVTLDGLEETRVTRVEKFTVKSVASREPSLTTLTPTLSLTLTEASADRWFDWLEAFTLQGNGDPEQERDGAILLLSSSRAELARIDLRGLGLCGLTPASTETSEPAAGAAPGPPHVTADLYVQQIGFSAADRPQAEAPTPGPRRPLRFQSILK